MTQEVHISRVNARGIRYRAHTFVLLASLERVTLKHHREEWESRRCCRTRRRSHTV